MQNDPRPADADADAGAGADADAVADADLAVVSNPQIRGGEPVVCGTRVPVYRLAELKAQGVDDEEILADHPSLTPELLSQALRYVERHPKPAGTTVPVPPWRAGGPLGSRG